ncbi:hypothetical protein HOD88_01300 [archaeon]|jgi:DNA mismatch repair protein MutS2|nr:hypothetical protein [archaeon]
MKQQILKFIEENNLSPFNSIKTQLQSNKNSIYKTRDAKSIHTKTLQKISNHFVFSDTSNLLNFFQFTNNPETIKQRQAFFREIKQLQLLDNSFLKQINKPKKWWHPRYDVSVVTEDHETFNKLKALNCPVQLLISEQDVVLLESKEVVQIINCPEYGRVLESLPQAIFIKDINEIYLERHLETFSGFIETINLLKENKTIEPINYLIDGLHKLISLTNNSESNSLDRDILEGKILKANELISEELKNLTFAGSSLVDILSKGILPENIKEVINNLISRLEIPRQVVEIGIPLKLDEPELERIIQRQNANEFSNLAESVKEQATELKQIPKKLFDLTNLLLFYDFLSGVNKFMKEEYIFPEISDNLEITNSKNLFLEIAQPISFQLSEEYKCSILTGANSGGKTTLVEHVLQLISLSQLGLPVSGQIKMPLFEEIYYFAKNKGSNLKGAFETLLTQMSKINPGNKTLILADEIEAVTEPGVAGNIIAATADYYIKQNCFLIVATHLGHEIQKILPEKCRIDGIEATGLTENFELIVNHNPVLGRLAHSTPELIVEKMANQEQKEYFKFLNYFLKNKKQF